MVRIDFDRSLVKNLFQGLQSEKGTILGIFRSLQALARAIGPLIASFGMMIISSFNENLISYSSILVDR
jgi:hypothetical protein